MYRLFRSIVLIPAICLSAACVSATGFSGRADQSFSKGGAVAQQTVTFDGGYPCATWVDGVVGGAVDVSACLTDAEHRVGWYRFNEDGTDLIPYIPLATKGATE